MIDLTQEALKPLREAAQLILDPPPHETTLNRWWRRGIRGVCLETLLVGGKRYTTRAAILRFIEATTAASLCHQAATPQPGSERRGRADRAAAQLEKILTPKRACE